MINHFARLSLPVIPKTCPITAKPVDFQKIISLVNRTTPKGLRDRVILLLRFRYGLKTGEIAKLELGAVDVETGVINISSRRRNRIVLLDPKVFPDFRRWATVRNLFVAETSAFIISMHWTAGRSIPYRKMSTRGVYQVVVDYVALAEQEGENNVASFNSSN